MAKLKGEAVQVRIKGVSTAKLLDDRFVALLRKEFPQIRYGPFHFYLPYESNGKKFESILLGYLDPDHEDKLLFTIDCDEPETLQRLSRLIEQFVEGSSG